MESSWANPLPVRVQAGISSNEPQAVRLGKVCRYATQVIPKLLYNIRRGQIFVPFFIALIFMKNKISARWVKDNISIVDLLTGLGFEPPKPVGKERKYISMLRDTDTDASFSVDEKKNVWHDHGEGIGGNIVELGLRYWKDLSFPEVLEKIVAVTNSGHLLNNPATLKRQKQPAATARHYHILKIQDVGLNHAITQYLQSRGIWQTAQGRLKEVYYYIEDAQKKRSNFFAAGWQNANGSWEIRSTLNFKACLGHKDISFIPGNKQSLAVFEGFIDYLSWLSENPFAEESVLVLNSVALLQTGIKKAAGFNQISLYFDNDPSGRKASLSFQKALPQAVDRSAIYEGYKDYNDKLVAELNQHQLHR